MNSIHPLRFRLAFGAWLAFVALAVSAAAQPVDDAARSAARRLGEEGMALSEKGDHDAALSRFERALGLMRVPTLAVLAAEELVKLGRWVEASEHYRRATGMQIDPTLPKAFRQTQTDAQAEAERALSALEKRIPTLTLRITPNADGVRVRLDDRELPPELLGVPMPLDPGAHRVEAERSGRREERSIVLDAGQSQSLAIELAEESTQAPALARRLETPTAVRDQPRRSRERSGWHTAGFVALGVGGAGLVVGSVAWGIARGKASDLEDRCSGGRCPAALRDDVDGYQSAKTVSTVGFVVAGIGLASGAVILLAAPKDETATRVGLGIGPGRVSLDARF